MADVYNVNPEQSNTADTMENTSDHPDQLDFRKRSLKFSNDTNGNNSSTNDYSENSSSVDEHNDENNPFRDNHDEIDAECDGGRYDGPSNFYAVVLYKIKKPRGHRKSGARTTALLLAGFGLAFSAVFCLIAISVSKQWGKCLTVDDCKLGMVCVRFEDESGYLNLPTCEDCSLMIGGTDYAMPPNDDAPSADVPCFNKSRQYYFDTDFDGSAASARFEKYPSTCLYVQYNTWTASRLDTFVSFIVITIIAFHAGAEAIQQDRVNSLRYYCMPLVLPGRSLSSWKRFASTLTLCLTEIMQKLLLANMPMTLTMLAVTDEVSASTMILDGLAITFFIFIDDIASLIILSDKMQRRRVEQYTGQLELRARRALNQFRGRDDVWIITLSTFSLSILGYYGVQRADNCESILYWLNYRIVVQFGIWFVSIFREIVFRLRQSRYLYTSHHELPDSKRGWIKVGCRFSAQVMKWFLNTLLVAFVQNLLFYFATHLYYDQPLVDAFNDYFWLTVRDVFGACAGIPWDPSFPCASPWPFPGDGDDGI